jgi:hypothetical protein
MAGKAVLNFRAERFNEKAVFFGSSSASMRVVITNIRKGDTVGRLQSF